MLPTPKASNYYNLIETSFDHYYLNRYGGEYALFFEGTPDFQRRSVNLFGSFSPEKGRKAPVAKVINERVTALPIQKELIETGLRRYLYGMIVVHEVKKWEVYDSEGNYITTNYDMVGECEAEKKSVELAQSFIRDYMPTNFRLMESYFTPSLEVDEREHSIGTI